MNENKDGFIELNVDVSEPDYHSTQNVAVKFCAYGFIVAPPIAFIFICIVFSMGITKSYYLWYKVVSDNCFDTVFIELNHVTYELSVSCWCFE